MILYGNLNPQECYVGRPVLLNGNERAVQYTGVPANTPAIIIDVNYDSDDDYCVNVEFELNGAVHQLLVKTSHFVFDLDAQVLAMAKSDYDDQNKAREFWGGLWVRPETYSAYLSDLNTTIEEAYKYDEKYSPIAICRILDLLLYSQDLVFQNEESQEEPSTINKASQAMLDLSATKGPFQLYHDVERGNIEREIEENPSNQWSFAQLSFFHDRQVPFSKILAAEALSVVVLHASTQEAANSSFGILQDCLAGKDFARDGWRVPFEEEEKTEIKIASARALAFIAKKHTSTTSSDLPYKALKTLVDLSVYGSKNSLFAAREGLQQIVAESSSIFSEPRNLQLFVDALKKDEISDGFFYDTLTSILINNPEAFQENPYILRQIEQAYSDKNFDLQRSFAFYASKILKEEAPPQLNGHSVVQAFEQLKTGPHQCLIVHNIREALGDEWIREEGLIQSLLRLNPELEITILGRRHFLYNHPRIKNVSIDKPEALKAISSSSYTLVVNQCYEIDPIAQSVQDFAVRNFRDQTPLYLETATATNYYCPGYAFISIEGRRTSLLEKHLPCNVYTPFLHLAARLNLPHDPFSKDNSLLNSLPNKRSQEWLEENIIQNKRAAHKTVMLYNPFGGSYEHKGYTKDERGLCVKFIEAAIDEGCFVLLPSFNKTPWANEATSQAIRSLLPQSQRSYCMVIPSPEESHISLTHLFSMVDRIVSMEGGLSHLALKSGKPTEVIQKIDGKARMWLPICRAPQQEEQETFSPPAQQFMHQEAEIAEMVRG